MEPIHPVKRAAKKIVSPVLARLRPANVAMLHLGRVGSQVVGNLLDQHSKIRWLSEVFNEHHIGHWTRYYQTSDPAEQLRFHMASAGLKVVGFETNFAPTHDLKRLDMSLESYARLLRDLGFTHIIILERRNHLRRYVSVKIGMRRGKWHDNAAKGTEGNAKGKTEAPGAADPREAAPGAVDSADGRSAREKPSKKEPIRIPTEGITYHTRTGERVFTIKELIDFYRGLYDEARAQFVDHLGLTYEDDIENDPRVAYTKVCRFIGVEPEDPDVTLRRTSPEPLHTLIENFDEVEAALKGTEHEWMLNA